MSDLVRPVGPVDILVVGFAENRFDGSIAPAIADLVARGIVRILDVVIISKDDDGELTLIEIADLDGDGVNDFAVLTGDIPGLIGEEDERAVADELPPGSTVAMLAWENTWAIGASMALRKAGAVVMAHERLAPGDVDAVLSAFELEGAGA
jgi:hypothetical protein